MKGKIIFGAMTTAFSISLFTGVSHAEEKGNVQPLPTSFATVSSFQLDTKKVLEEAKRQEIGFIPSNLKELVSFKESENSIPVFFPTEEINSIVQEGKIVGQQLLMEAPELDSKIQRILEDGHTIQILEEVKDAKQESVWYKVKITDKIEAEVEGVKETKIEETIGFISPEYIQVIDPETKEEVINKEKKVLKEKKEVVIQEIKVEIQKEKERKDLEEKQRLEREKANSVIQTARQFLGRPYVFGAAPGRTSAFDCSSYTQYVFKQYGVSLPRTAATQFGVGTRVSKSELKTGDLVFFETYKPGASHVGIYIGNGQFIGAQSSGVGYASIYDSYWSKRYLGARRIL